MRKAADYRLMARDALKGRWTVAVIAGLVASLLGASGSESVNFGGSGGININIENNRIVTEPEFSREITELFRRIEPGVLAAVAVALVSAVFIGLAIGIAWSLLGSIIRVGYVKFNNTLIAREQEPQTGDLFSFFKQWKPIVLTSLLQGLYVFLLTLLFIIPGILAAYSYAAVPYLLAENPELKPREALARSKELMYGHRWELFCLGFSFIGWSFLCAFTFGIGNLWLNPYVAAAEAAFMRDLTNPPMGAGPEQ